jgi:hypothetical protein
MDGTAEQHQEPEQSAPEPTQTVKVSLMGGDAQTFDYVEGRTVAEWLQDADITVKGDQSVSLNGDTAGLDTAVEPNSIIVVADKISNG